MLPLNKDTYQVQLHATVIRAGTTSHKQACGFVKDLVLSVIDT